MNYDDEIRLSQEMGIIHKSDIFDYRETPFEVLFENYYFFCRENLNNCMKTYGISPCIFIFNNYQIENAKAEFYNNCFSIQINFGLFKKCILSYMKNAKLDEYLSNKYSNLLIDFDNPLSTLAFQVSTQFTYYHELAHLIQFSKVREQFSFQERNDSEDLFDIEKQSLEINADTFASIAIASHIQQYIKKSFEKNINQEKFELTIILISSCLLNYLASFCDDVIDFNLKKNAHPHPFLRLLAINLNILNYIKQSELFLENQIKINIKNLIKQIFYFYQDLEKNKIFDTNLTSLINNGAKNQNEMITHLGNLIEFRTEKYKDAIDEWNRHKT